MHTSNEFLINEEMLKNLQNTMANSGMTEFKAQPEDIDFQRQVLTHEIVTIVAYLIGVKKEELDRVYKQYNEKTILELDENREARILRDLCYIRTQLIRHYNAIENNIIYNMIAPEKTKYFDGLKYNVFDDLKTMGVGIDFTGERTDRCLKIVCLEINDRIKACRTLFGEWLNWDYVKDLFVFNNPDPDSLRSERNIYQANKSFYPYGAYIRWKPEDSGNILYNDARFLEILYAQHGDKFIDESKYKDAGVRTKGNIHDFIENGTNVEIVVDCENSDLFKLYSVLSGLDEEKIKRIRRIVLYDDLHTTEAWDWLGDNTKIEVEHVEVERLLNEKSLVDIRMTVGICKEHYENGVDSFILFSSDSDYWGLISSLPQVKFLVMYEGSKVSHNTLSAFFDHRITSCCIDDFCTADADVLKRKILIGALKRELQDVIGRTPIEIAKSVYEKTRITATMEEITSFCEKYVKKLKLTLDADGVWTIILQ